MLLSRRPFHLSLTPQQPLQPRRPLHPDPDPGRQHRCRTHDRHVLPGPGDGRVEQFLGQDRRWLLGQDDDDPVKLRALALVNRQRKGRVVQG